ncbi:hypothetical protein NPIL_472751 [Nephila pilipes]|uniref:Uncharacterized protein n=1 Tax=Nephila pilipes TaxID=299642 RepID=A0A8X6QYR6_NEPPI|nr:hypothetical protein NPIL_472751 [Nephila pilipes]
MMELVRARASTPTRPWPAWRCAGSGGCAVAVSSAHIMDAVTIIAPGRILGPCDEPGGPSGHTIHHQTPHGAGARVRRRSERRRRRSREGCGLWSAHC